MLVVISIWQLTTPLAKQLCFWVFFTCSSSCIEAAKGSPSARRAIIVKSTISPRFLGCSSSLKTAAGKLCEYLTGCKVTTLQGWCAELAGNARAWCVTVKWFRHLVMRNLWINKQFRRTIKKKNKNILYAVIPFFLFYIFKNLLF